MIEMTETHDFQVRQLAVGGFDHNFSYLIVASDGDAALVDPTGDATVIARAVKAAGAIHPRFILLTHSHPDHCAALAAALEFFPAPVYAHPLAALRLPSGRPLADRELLALGEGGFIEVLFTPGHTPDSVCFRLSDDSGVFTGDTLFVGCCGYCEPERMFRSLQRLKTLADGNRIYSGHDYGVTPTATLGAEKRDNPCLRAATLAEFRKVLEEEN